MSLGDVQAWSQAVEAQKAIEQAEAPKIAAVTAVAPEAKPKKQVPDLPPNIVACLKKNEELRQKAKAKGVSTADEMVLNEVQSEDERNACTKAMLDWYRGLQKANKPKAAKV